MEAVERMFRIEKGTFAIGECPKNIDLVLFCIMTGKQAFAPEKKGQQDIDRGEFESKLSFTRNPMGGPRTDENRVFYRVVYNE